MGCCSSRQAASADNDDITASAPVRHPPTAYRPNSTDATDSARNIITATSPSRHSSTVSQPPAPGLPPQPKSRTNTIAPNPPLRLLDPNRTCKLPDPLTIPTSTASHNPTDARWTRAKLERERRDWWDTRDTGSREIWEAYRVMVAHLQRGELEEAQTLLDACGCTCPSGKLWHAIYDERGVEYAVRDSAGRRNYEWLVFEPRDLLEEEEEIRKEVGMGVGKSGVDEGVDSGPDLDSLDGGSGKGKQRVREEAVDTDKHVGQVVKVRCRLSSTGRDCVVEYRKGDSIGSIMAALSPVTGLEPKRHRISYLGRLYGANEHLPTKGERAWKEHNVLSVLVMEGP